MEVRALGIQDMDAIMEASARQPLLMKAIKPESYQRHLADVILPRYLKEDSPHLIVGSFVDNKLVTYGCAFVWTEFPYWTLCNLHSIAVQTRTDLLRGGLSGVVKKLVEETQKKQLYRMMFLTPVRGKFFAHPEKYKSLLVRAAPELDKYNFFTEAYVPANTRPTYDYQWQMMGERERPFDTLIRAAELDQVYRTDYVEKVREYTKRNAP